MPGVNKGKPTAVTAISIVRPSDIIDSVGPEKSMQIAINVGRALGPPPTFSSFLQRKGGMGLKGLRSWHRFFFVLDDSGLAWFDKEDQAKERRSARGRVPMHLLVGAEVATSKGPCRFVIHARSPRGEGNRHLYLEAESPALMARWLELVGRHLHERSDGLCFANASAPPLAAGTAETFARPPTSSAVPAGTSSRRRSLSDESGGSGGRRASLRALFSSAKRAGSSSILGFGSTRRGSSGGASVKDELVATRRAAAAAAARRLAELTRSGGEADSGVAWSADRRPGVADGPSSGRDRDLSSVAVSVDGVNSSRSATRDPNASASKLPGTPLPSLRTTLADDDELDPSATFIGEELERRVLAVKGNAVCADCATSDARKYAALPTWGSTNLGVTFCIRCSGIHRKMGAHVTKVLSLTIDTWTAAQLTHMRTLGNAAVSAELEASLPPGIKPDSSTCAPAMLESFIRAKYELGSFRVGGDGRLPEVLEVAMEGEAAASAQAKAMAEFCGLLIIRLIRATNLPATDLLGTKTDAFFEFSLGERKCQSKVKGSLNPVWNETLSLNVRSLSESLILKLFDKAKLTGPEYVGQCLLPLADLPHDGMPMGFDLTIDQASAAKGATGVLGTARDGRRMVKKGGSTASVAIEVTYNPLDR